MTGFPFDRGRLVLLLVAGVLVGCSSPTSGDLDTFAGEWCTERGLGSDNLPDSGVSYVAMTLIEDGTRLSGTGATSRPTSDSIFPASFQGDIVSGRGIIDVTDLDSATVSPGPVFTLDLEKAGPRDLVGTMSGDPDFAGPITLVRLGQECYAE